LAKPLSKGKPSPHLTPKIMAHKRGEERIPYGSNRPWSGKPPVQVKTNYSIEFNKRKKRWILKRKGTTVFSSTQKMDVDFWYEEIIAKNCTIF
jgi:hypothetical protein